MPTRRSKSEDVKIEDAFKRIWARTALAVKAQLAETDPYKGSSKLSDEAFAQAVAAGMVAGLGSFIEEFQISIRPPEE